MRNEITLTDDQIEDIFGNLDFETYIEDLAFTRNTISEFKDGRSAWNELGTINKKSTCDNYDCFIVDNCQAVKGQPRKRVCVVDFGTVRAVAKAF